MNKFTLILLILALTAQISFGQSISKIRGNRDVTVEQTYIDDFSSLIIKNDFEVKLAYNSKTSVEITADSNLHNVINVEVNAGVLSISSSKRITSKKKLLITVNYSENLNNIELYNDTELNGLTSLELDSLSIKAENNAEANFTVKSKLFKYIGSGKSKSRFNITSDSTSFVLNNNSKINALVNAKTSIFELNQDANSTIEGDVENCILRLENSSYFKGRNYAINNANIDTKESTNADINIISSLTLRASGNSKTNIYGKPKINLELFTDTARIQKKKD